MSESIGEKVSCGSLMADTSGKGKHQGKGLLIECGVVWTGVEPLDYTDVSRLKGGLAVAKVVVPFSRKASVEAELPHPRQIEVKAVSPLAEGFGVIAPEVPQLMDDEPPVLLHQLVEPVLRQQERPGKDMLLDKVDARPECLVTAVGAGDELEGHEAIGFEEPVAAFAEGRMILMTDRFEHLDGDNLAVFAGEIAVVAEADIHEMGETLACDSGSRVFMLRR